MTPLLLAAVALACALAALLRRRRRREAHAAALARWADEHPHLVALAADLGPSAGLLAGTVDDAEIRRWHAERMSEGSGR